MGSPPWQQLRDVMPRVLKNFETGVGSAFQKVLENWQTVVGSDVARHAVPHALRHKVLFIVVDSSTWAAELSAFQAEAIIEALNEVLGSTEIRALRCLTRRSTRRDDSAGERHAEEPNQI